MSKVLKRLYLGDVVKSFGTKQLRKLTTALGLTTPLFSLADTSLTITDETNQAEAFNVYCDGQILTTCIAKQKTVESSGTSCTLTIDCNVGDTIVVSIGAWLPFTLNDGWTLISSSEINPNDTSTSEKHMRLSWAYKIADNTTESIVITRTASCYVHACAIVLTGAVKLTDEGYSYCASDGTERITVTKPKEKVLWGMVISSTAYAWYWRQDSPLVPVISTNYTGLAYDVNIAMGTALTLKHDYLDGSTRYVTVGCLSLGG